PDAVRRAGYLHPSELRSRPDFGNVAVRPRDSRTGTQRGGFGGGRSATLHRGVRAVAHRGTETDKRSVRVGSGLSVRTRPTGRAANHSVSDGVRDTDT